MRFDVITLFPGMFECMRGQGLTGKALEAGPAELVLWNPRDFTRDLHRTVDDRPYGGGPGMVMKYEPLRDAIAAARAAAPAGTEVIYLSPQGRVLDQAAVARFADRPGLILLAGRYEGVDERLVERHVDAEWSIGDYVLSGGELAAMVLMDAVIRLLPGVLGHADSAAQDSHVEGILDCPHYTRPEVVDGMGVPPVLRSGDHEAIRRWRLQQALGRTRERRPDLFARLRLDEERTELLEEFIRARRAPQESE